MVADPQAQTTAADLTWTPGTVNIQGQILPCQRGISTDGMTAAEIVGNEDMTIAVTLVGILSPTQEAVTRRNAAYAGVLLSKIVPTWKGAHAWLAGRLREMRRQPHAEIRVSGWQIALDFNAVTATLTFRATR